MAKENVINVEVDTPAGVQNLTFPEGTLDSVIEGKVQETIQQFSMPEPEVAIPPPPEAAVPEHLEDAPIRRKIHEVGPLPWQMAGGAAGTIPGLATANPAVMVAGATLGAGAGRGIYEAITGDYNWERPLDGWNDPDAYVKGAWPIVHSMKDEFMWGTGFMSIAPAWRIARSYGPRMLGINEDASLRIAQVGAQHGMDIGILDVSKNKLIQGFATTVGRMPIIGKPVGQHQIRQHVQSQAAINQMLDDVTPWATTSALLGINMSRAAIRTSMVLKNHYRLIYTAADNYAIQFGRIIPTAHMKLAMNKIDEALHMPVLKTGPKAGQRAGAGGNTELEDLIDDIRHLDDRVDVVELRALTKRLNSIQGRAHITGTDIFKANETRLSLEHAFTQIDVSALPSDVGRRIISSYKFANRYYVGTQATLESTVAQQFKKVSDIRQAFKGGFAKPGILNADELSDLALNARSPEAVRALRDLLVGPKALFGDAAQELGLRAALTIRNTGENIFKQAVRRHISGAFERATRQVQQKSFLGIEFGGGRTINLKALRNNLGLGTSKQSREALEEMLKGTGTTIKEVEQFVDALGVLDEIVIPSKFVARRMMLGGFKSGLRGATGIGALAGSTGGAVTAGGLTSMSFYSALAGVIGIRMMGRFLTNPQFLKRALRMGDAIERAQAKTLGRGAPHVRPEEGTLMRQGIGKEGYLPLEAKLQNFARYLNNTMDAMFGEDTPLYPGDISNAAQSYMEGVLGDIEDTGLLDNIPTIEGVRKVLGNFIPKAISDADASATVAVRENFDSVIHGKIDRAFMEGNTAELTAVKNSTSLKGEYFRGLQKNPDRLVSQMIGQHPEDTIRVLMSVSTLGGKDMSSTMLKRIRKTLGSDHYGKFDLNNLKSSDEWQELRRTYFKQLVALSTELPQPKAEIASMMFGSGRPIIQQLYTESEANRIRKLLRMKLRYLPGHSAKARQDELMDEISAILGMSSITMDVGNVITEEGQDRTGSIVGPSGEATAFWPQQEAGIPPVEPTGIVPPQQPVLTQ